MAQHYKNADITKSRVKVFLGWEHFNPKGNVAPGRMDQNLCGRLWTHHHRPAITLSAASPSSPLTKAIPSALKALAFRPSAVGETFGPTFSNHVFRLEITIPSSMHNLPVHLLWDSNSEAMVLTENGIPVQGLVGGDHWCRRADYPLFPGRPGNVARAGEKLCLYIEIACNGLFGAGRGGDIEPPDMNRFYKLEECCLAVFDPVAWDLIHDLTLLSSLADNLPDIPRRSQALQVANEVVNVVHVDEPRSYLRGREIAAKFLKCKNGGSQSVVHSMLHSHIDLAWLWPMESTPAKGARTFATQLRLLERYPESIYVQSQAQLYDWVKTYYPALWKQVCKRVADGRFVPVGATWVEMDCNIPSGESLVRQFVVGQRFFEENFGIRCDEFWLPDTFGYCAQLPQIMKGCGVSHFLTQKLSWNLFNKFPHSSFVWEGLDGSRVLAHMPPADTYNSQAFPDEVLRSANKNKDAGIFNASMMLVGHGDGGGGASPAMVESMTRMRDLDGVPQVRFSTPKKFFAELRRMEYQLPRWVGELYFELHRGTYTTQAQTKRSNRECEILLRDLESVATQAILLASISGRSYSYPYVILDKCWKLLLKNCFHDTLPGSCIGRVYDETRRDYKYILEHGSRAIEEAFRFIAVLLSTHGSLITQVKKRRKTEKPNSAAKETLGYSTTEITVNSISSPGLLMLRGTGLRSKGDRPIVVDTLINPQEMMSEVLVQKCRYMPHRGSPGMKGTESGDQASLVALKSPIGGLGLISNPALVQLTTTENYVYPATIESSHTSEGKCFILKNRNITAKIDVCGRLASLVLRSPLGKAREALAATYRAGCGKPGGNRLVIFDDVPQFWCGWDTEVYSFEKHFEISSAESCEIFEEGPLRVGLQVLYPPTRAGSIIRQFIFLRAESPMLEFHTEVDWKESRKMLRVLFDTEVRSAHASYGSQFGFVTRPTTFNQSWEIAKFEVIGHQFSDLSETGFGIALLSDYKYGYSVRDSTLRLSLLRASKSPDDRADQGTHKFVYALMPHWDSFPNVAVLDCAAELGSPPAIISTKLSANDRVLAPNVDLTFAIVNDMPTCLNSVVISAVKLAEHNSNSVVVRLYEALGARGKARLRCPHGLAAESSRSCNMTEEGGREETSKLRYESTHDDEDAFDLVVDFKPFQIRTLMIDLAGNKLDPLTSI